MCGGKTNGKVHHHVWEGVPGGECRVRNRYRGRRPAGRVICPGVKKKQLTGQDKPAGTENKMWNHAKQQNPPIGTAGVA